MKPTYNLIEYSNNYEKTSGNLCKYLKDDPNDNITDSQLSKFKARITGRASAAGNANDVDIFLPLKYMSNFWRAL